MGLNNSICDICGANYIFKNGRWLCPACGAIKVESEDNEESTLISIAYQKLRLSNFDDAVILFKDIISKYPENSEAYWGLLLAQYGIKYEIDFDSKLIATCYNASYESFLNNINYNKALKYASKEQIIYYKKEALKIEAIREELINKANKEKPYDIFLSYKDSEINDPNTPTKDREEVLKIYKYLTKKGYRVFLSRESLKDKTGEKYEPYIFNAINTTKMMIVYSSNVEYVESTWIHNEWSRFYSKIKNKEKLEGSLIVCCKGFNPSLLPNPLNKLQCLDANNNTFINDLANVIKKIFNSNKNNKPNKFSSITKSNTFKILTGSFITSALVIATAISIYNVNNDDNNISQTYEVIWKNYDGTILEKEFINYGDTAEYNGASPTKESDNYYNYTFSGWSPTPSIITGDISYTANFDISDRLYNVIFEDKDGTILQSSYYIYGELPEYKGKEPYIPENDTFRYSFNGWRPKISNVTSDITYTAEYLMGYLMCHVIWKDYDGTILYETDCETGTIPQYVGELPKREDDELREYFFSGWSIPEDSLVFGDTVYVAQYEVFQIKFKALWKDYDGRVLDEKVYKYGETPIFEGETPIRNSDDEYYYEFNEWSRENDEDGNVIFTAKYNAYKNKYNVTWKNYDGTILEIDEKVKYNESATYDGETPIRNSDDEYYYEFSGWDEEVDKENGDIVYTAKYNAYKNKYNVTWKNYDGTILDEKAYKYGESPIYSGETPYRISNVEYSYEFSGWEEVNDISGDIIYVAQYNAYKNKYKVTWKNYDGTILEIDDSVEYGVTPSYNGSIPIKQSDINYDYQFNGWSPEVSQVNGDVTYEATFKIKVKYEYSEGLNYINNGNNTVSISGIGSCSDVNIIIPEYNEYGQKVTEIGKSAFEQNLDIKSVVIPDTVTKIGSGVFYGCSNLSEVTMPTYLEEMGIGVFDGTKIKKIEIPEGLTELPQYTFMKCYSLIVCKLPSTLKIIGDGAFEGCTNLEILNIPENLEIIDVNAFAYCSKLKIKELPDSVTYIGGGIFGAFYRCFELGLEKLPSNIEYIGDKAFDFANIGSITLNDNLTYIGDRAFINCTMASEYLKIPESVTYLGTEAFNGCRGVKKIELSSSINEIPEKCFTGMLDLETVIITDTITRINYQAFDSSNINKLEIPASVTYFGDMIFKNCVNLKEINYLGTIEEFNAIYKEEYWNEGSYLEKISCIDGTIYL